MTNKSALVMLALLLTACGNQTGNTAEEPVLDEENLAALGHDSSAPNYDEREGDLYMYVAAVSEEKRKTGEVAGDVILFRYLGATDGVHRLENVTDAGVRIDVAECARPCKVIKLTRPDGTIGRLGFNADSIIGMAFEDAFAGRLEVAKAASNISSSAESATPEPKASVIPSAFTGEWNTNLEHCGTGLNDSRLRVEPRRLRFYESDAEVTDVTIRNSRAVVVEASYSGEGETWNDKVSMVLSRSGSDLTIDGFTRHRCP